MLNSVTGAVVEKNPFEDGFICNYHRTKPSDINILKTKFTVNCNRANNVQSYFLLNCDKILNYI